MEISLALVTAAILFGGHTVAEATTTTSITTTTALQCIDTRASGSGLHGGDTRGSYTNGVSSQCVYYKNQGHCKDVDLGCDKTCGLCPSGSQAGITSTNTSSSSTTTIVQAALTKATSANDGTIYCSAYCANNWNSEMPTGWIGACCLIARIYGMSHSVSCTETYSTGVECICQRDDGRPFLTTMQLTDTRYVCAQVAFTIIGADGAGAQANGAWNNNGIHNGKPKYVRAGCSMEWESNNDWAVSALGTPGQPKWVIGCSGHHRYYAEQDTATPPTNSWIPRGGLASGVITLIYQGGCTVPSTVGYDFSSVGGSTNISGFNPSGVVCTDGYTGTVAYAVCPSVGYPYSVSGCQAANSTNVTVEGSMTLQMTNVTQFINEPNLTAFLTTTIAEIFNVDPSWVHNVIVSLVSLDRRLLRRDDHIEASVIRRHERVLIGSTANSGVKVDFDVIVSHVMAQVVAAGLLSTFNAATPQELSNIINKLARSGYLGQTYVVEVIEKIAAVQQPPVAQAQSPDEEKAGIGIGVIAAVIAGNSVAFCGALFLVGTIYACRERRRKAALKYDRGIDEWSASELLSPPDIISARLKLCLDRACMSVFAAADPEVYVTFAVGRREVDVENTGPGVFFVAAVGKALFARGVRCCVNLRHVDMCWQQRDGAEFIADPNAKVKVLIVVETRALYDSEFCLREIFAAMESNVEVIRVLFEAIPDSYERWSQIKLSSGHVRCKIGLRTFTLEEMRKSVLLKLDVLSPLPPITIQGSNHQQEKQLEDIAANVQSKLTSRTVFPMGPPDLPPGKRFHYFLSHKKEHSIHGKVSEHVALALHDALESKGWVGFFDVDNLKIISQEEIRRNIQDSCSVIAVLTDETTQSEWCMLEWDMAEQCGLPVACVVDVLRFNKRAILNQVSSTNTHLLKHQWIEYTERYRKVVVNDCVEWLEKIIKCDDGQGSTLLGQASSSDALLGSASSSDTGENVGFISGQKSSNAAQPTTQIDWPSDAQASSKSGCGGRRANDREHGKLCQSGKAKTKGRGRNFQCDTGRTRDSHDSGENRRQEKKCPQALSTPTKQHSAPSLSATAGTTKAGMRIEAHPTAGTDDSICPTRIGSSEMGVSEKASAANTGTCNKGQDESGPRLVGHATGDKQLMDKARMITSRHVKCIRNKAQDGINPKRIGHASRDQKLSGSSASFSIDSIPRSFPPVLAIGSKRRACNKVQSPNRLGAGSCSSESSKPKSAQPTAPLSESKARGCKKPQVANSSPVRRPGNAKARTGEKNKDSSASIGGDVVVGGMSLEWTNQNDTNKQPDAGLNKLRADTKNKEASKGRKVG